MRTTSAWPHAEAPAGPDRELGARRSLRDESGLTEEFPGWP